MLHLSASFVRDLVYYIEREFRETRLIEHQTLHELLQQLSRKIVYLNLLSVHGEPQDWKCVGMFMYLFDCRDL